MKKHEFMKELETHLRPLPPHIRRELLEDMEQHFTFGMASGKSEEDISRELGHPVDIAIEALEEFPTAQVEGIQDETLQASTMQDWTSAPVKKRHPVATALIIIGLVLLNLMIGLPVFSVIWSLWFSLAAIAISCLVAPLALIAEWIMNREFHWFNLFLSLFMTGAGILLFMAVRRWMQRLAYFTVHYWRKNLSYVEGKSS
ncbi:DUF1700 domain-containing protein [Paenibacillus massiliensis]|uniref:DUF1700 domain-containing protein n=1 Tax=Paenibacillus massiliensis TaxID=225917 RepID=UPI000364A7FE|nr:DUF1700 domain-containing protein [Paenibacillus massiliensis]